MLLYKKIECNAGGQEQSCSLARAVFLVGITLRTIHFGRIHVIQSFTLTTYGPTRYGRTYLISYRHTPLNMRGLG